MAAAVAVAGISAAQAAVSVTDQGVLRKQQQKAAGASRQLNGPLKSTGSVSLIDSGGLKYFINTNITFSTTSSASGAMSEASYTGPHAVTTMNGGNVNSTLNDAFDGYNTMCVSLNNTIANCETGNANFVIYNKNGAAAADMACQEGSPAAPRQYTFPNKVSGSLTMSRKVYVPAGDQFARWLNSFTNTGSSPMTVTMVVANNLGSDSNTLMTAASTGAVPSPKSNVTPFTNTAATWIASMQDYSGTTSSDPRLGHVLQQAGAAVPLAGIHFVNQDDNPYWGYTFTLAPGQTRVIANFVTGQNSKAAAAAKAAQIASGANGNALNCMTPTEKTQLANFLAAAPVVAGVPTLDNFYLALLALLLAAGAGYTVQRRRTGR